MVHLPYRATEVPVRTITQAELKELVEQLPSAVRAWEHFVDVRCRLIAGAAVEPGPYKPEILTDNRKILTRGKLVEALGEHETERIFGAMADVPVRRLGIRKGRGKALGYAELGRRRVIR